MGRGGVGREAAASALLSLPWLQRGPAPDPAAWVPDPPEGRGPSQAANHLKTSPSRDRRHLKASQSERHHEMRKCSKRPQSDHIQSSSTFPISASRPRLLPKLLITVPLGSPLPRVPKTISASMVHAQCTGSPHPAGRSAEGPAC